MSGLPIPEPQAHSSPIGVGILGAGPVTQAIHLPTLARLGDVFTVVRVMDVDRAVAEAVAGRVGAGWTTGVEELLADPAVEVVAICSPHGFHAEQVIAACRAGKRAVLCEKPFAMTPEQAEAIAAVAAETRTPIVVGAMHTFDPGWLAAKAHWDDLVTTAHTVRSSITLPPNPRFEDFATEVVARPAVPPTDRNDPEVAAQLIHGGIMDLAIHDLPLVRAFCPDFADLEVRSCILPHPGGYLVNLRLGDNDVQLVAVSTEGWELEWIFEAISDDAALRIDFTPSYVQAGSATAVLRRGPESTTYGPYASNGYEEEWRFLAGLVRGAEQPPVLEDLINDLRFALAVASGASEAVRATVSSQQEPAA